MCANLMTRGVDSPLWYYYGEVGKFVGYIVAPAYNGFRGSPLTPILYFWLESH